MAIGSIGSSTVSTTVDSKRGGGRPAPVAAKTIADHVAALDDQQPIRSVSATRGTLIDTFL